MNSFKARALLVCFALVGCSDSAPAPAGKTAARSTSADAIASILADPARLKAYVAMLERNPAALDSLEMRDKEEAAELANLKEVNQKMCTKIQQLRSSCAPTYRLVAGDGEKDLACASGNSEQSVFNPKWEVKFGANRKYRLVADGNWESSEFSQGTTTITWRAKTPSSTSSPRLIDVTQIQLYPSDGASISDTAGFSLIVNGSEAISVNDLIWPKESNGYYVINMQRIINLRSAAECKLTQSDLDAILKGGQ